MMGISLCGRFHLGLVVLLGTSLPWLGIEGRFLRCGVGWKVAMIGRDAGASGVKVGCLSHLRLRGGRQVGESEGGDLVSGFLRSAGLEAHAEAFSRERIQHHNLRELGREDLEELGLSLAEAEKFRSFVELGGGPASQHNRAGPSIRGAHARLGKTTIGGRGKGDQPDAEIGEIKQEATGGGSISGKETTRLETLMVLLSSGTTGISRSTAAEQLAQLYRSHAQLRYSLVARCLPLLHSLAWETRAAAGHALDEMARIEAEEGALVKHSDELASIGESAAELEGLCLEAEMEYGPFLLASEGDDVSDEFDVGKKRKGGGCQGGKRARAQLPHQQEKDEPADIGKKQAVKDQGSSRGVATDKLVISFQGGSKSSQGAAASIADEALWPFSKALADMSRDVAHHRWEDRHGAALGIRNVLRRNSGRRDMAGDEWVAIVRGLAIVLLRVLARDRFSDFSGDLAMSPVRETVAQALGEAAAALDCISVRGIFKALRMMQAHEGEWEVRQSALLGLKYLLAACKINLALDLASAANVS